jgi:hypothetical protein
MEYLKTLSYCISFAFICPNSFALSLSPDTAFIEPRDNYCNYDFEPDTIEVENNTEDTIYIDSLDLKIIYPLDSLTLDLCEELSRIAIHDNDWASAEFDIITQSDIYFYNIDFDKISDTLYRARRDTGSGGDGTEHLRELQIPSNGSIKIVVWAVGQCIECVAPSYFRGLVTKIGLYSSNDREVWFTVTDTIIPATGARLVPVNKQHLVVSGSSSVCRFNLQGRNINTSSNASGLIITKTMRNRNYPGYSVRICD